jgi:hypothetical protein
VRRDELDDFDELRREVDELLRRDDADVARRVRRRPVVGR